MLSKRRQIEVSCRPAGAGGWHCDVTVASGSQTTDHSVSVVPADLDRWGRGGSAEDLVRRAFEFLLEREPADSILRQFELAVIERYFPEFDQEFGDATPP